LNLSQKNIVKSIESKKINLDHDDAKRAIDKLDRDAQRNQKQIDRLEKDIEELRLERKEVLKKIAAA